ncbi:MAG: hypothetical protein J6W28_01795 [Clostridia bacterium]|nr:hypothetical protein [Clostridia bacterium]
MRATKKLTVTALMAALSVVILSLGSLLGVLDLSAAALASFLTALLHMELGKRYAVSYWAVASLASLLILPENGAALFFATAGLYPLLKLALERLAPWFEWLFKLLVFGGMLAAYILLAKFVFLLPDAALSGWLLWVLVGLATIAFILYDLALTRLMIHYGLRLRARFARFFQ